MTYIHIYTVFVHDLYIFPILYDFMAMVPIDFQKPPEKGAVG